MGDDFEFKCLFRILSNGASGIIASIGQCVAAVGFCYGDSITFLLNDDNSLSVIMSHEKKVGNFTISQTVTMPFWHKLLVSLKNKIMTISYDDISISRPQNPEFPWFADPIFINIGMNNDLNQLYFNIPLKPGNNIGVKNIYLNDKLVKTVDFNGNALKCPPIYGFDNPVGLISGVITDCDKLCETKYISQYAQTSDYFNIKCCQNGNVLGSSCDIGKTKDGKNPVIAIQQLDDHVQCVYDPMLITTLDQATNSIALYGPNVSDNPILKSFCQSPSEYCPIDSKSCSRVFSTDDREIDLCAKAYNNLSRLEKDSWMTDYCSRWNTQDCICFNRNDDPIYKKLKLNNPYLDSCWYIPCKDGGRGFIPSDVDLADADPTHHHECPSNICQVIYDISQARSVDVEDNKTIIQCGSSSSTPQITWVYSILLALGFLLLITYTFKK
jgi:hypothetical protein